MTGPTPASYAAAGVDIEAADRAVSRLARHARATFRPEVVGDIGGFGAGFALPAGYREPVMVSATDGAGTKTAVADLMGRHDTIGIDLVAMCVDDLVCTGAEPLFFLDLITCGAVDEDRIDALVAGMAEGCATAGCSLVGGEIAEHPGLMEPHQWDIGGFAVGVVERAEVLDGVRDVAVGDRVVGLVSPGLRCNGYSLARRVLLGTDGPDEVGRRDEPAWPGADVSVGEELLRPSVIYATAVRAALAAAEIHAVAHVTGGGLPGNVDRVLGPDVDAVLDRSRWSEPPVFEEIARRGGVAADEMARTFNLGIGMVLIVPAGEVAATVGALAGHDVEAMDIGHIAAGSGSVQLVGTP